MAMPTDFWRNDQMLNIFRTKPCQRLARDGVCGWKSQCQFSHSLEWPRRQPRRYSYSPELCPSIHVVKDADGGTVRMENKCNAGLRCPWAHSKEEVLFHPHIFKTILCDDHAKNAGRGNKKNKCHRYYCPFAHGSDELRASPLSAEQRDKCLKAAEDFASDACCPVCVCPWTTPPVGTINASEEIREKFPDVASLNFGVPPAISPAPGLEKPMGGPQLWDMLYTGPMAQGGFPKDFGLGLKQPMDFTANGMEAKMAAAKDYLPTLPPFGKPPHDSLISPQKPSMPDSLISPQHSLFSQGDPFGSLRVTSLSDDSPAFIAFDGYPGSQRQPTKPTQEREMLQAENDKVMYHYL